MTARSQKTICTDDCCKAENNAVRAAFNGYAAVLALHGFALPGLIPQVDLHHRRDGGLLRPQVAGWSASGRTPDAPPRPAPRL